MALGMTWRDMFEHVWANLIANYFSRMLYSKCAVVPEFSAETTTINHPNIGANSSHLWDQNPIDADQEISIHAHSHEIGSWCKPDEASGKLQVIIRFFKLLIPLMHGHPGVCWGNRRLQTLNISSTGPAFAFYMCKCASIVPKGRRKTRIQTNAAALFPWDLLFLVKWPFKWHDISHILHSTLPTRAVAMCGCLTQNVSLWGYSPRSYISLDSSWLQKCSDINYIILYNNIISIVYYIYLWLWYIYIYSIWICMNKYIDAYIYIYTRMHMHIIEWYWMHIECMLLQIHWDPKGGLALALA